jgi:hypothetical protein
MIAGGAARFCIAVFGGAESENAVAGRHGLEFGIRVAGLAGEQCWHHGGVTLQSYIRAADVAEIAEVANIAVASATPVIIPLRQRPGRALFLPLRETYSIRIIEVFCPAIRVPSWYNWWMAGAEYDPDSIAAGDSCAVRVL